MNTHIEKTKVNLNHSFMNAESKKQSIGGSTFQFTDNRPHSIVQQFTDGRLSRPISIQKESNEAQEFGFIDSRPNIVSQRIVDERPDQLSTIGLAPSTSTIQRNKNRGGNKHTMRSNKTKFRAEKSHRKQKSKAPKKKSKRTREREEARYQERQQNRNNDTVTLKWYHYFMLFLLATTLLPQVNATRAPKRKGRDSNTSEDDNVLLSFGSSSHISLNNTCSIDELTNGLNQFSPFSSLSIDTTSTAPLYSELQHVTCEDDVREMCTTARSNSAYNDILKMVDDKCKNITISSPKAGSGECRYHDTPGDRTGDLSCDSSGSYQPSLVGHELEHAKDSCNMQYNMGVGLSRTRGGIKSEINAHTRQAAIAKIQMRNGKSVSSRDRDLVKSFDAGNPVPKNKSRIEIQDNMYNIVHSYHKLYIKEDLSLKDLIAKYSSKIQKANQEYLDLINKI